MRIKYLLCIICISLFSIKCLGDTHSIFFKTGLGYYNHLIDKSTAPEMGENWSGRSPTIASLGSYKTIDSKNSIGLFLDYFIEKGSCNSQSPNNRCNYSIYRLKNVFYGISYLRLASDVKRRLPGYFLEGKFGLSRNSLIIDNSTKGYNNTTVGLMIGYGGDFPISENFHLLIGMKVYNLFLNSTDFFEKGPINGFLISIELII